jgi:hypothetical protein
MSDPRSRPDDRPNIGSEPLEDEVFALQGDEPPRDQDAVVDVDEVEDPDEPTMTELDRAETTSRSVDRDEALSIEGLAMDELQPDTTDDPDVAAEEGLAWVPPTDPPFAADPESPDGIVVAAGLGTTALDEPYDEDHRSGELSDEPDLTARIREAIRADAATSRYADQIIVATIGSTAVLRGVVDDLGDGDDLAAVVERVDGIEDVRDETDVAGL